MKGILLIVALLCLVGTASATISYHAGYDRILVTGNDEVNITLTDLDASAVGEYVHDMGSGIWYLNRSLWVQNGASVKLDYSEVTELRQSRGTASIWMDFGTDTKLWMDGVTWKSWDNSTDTANFTWKDARIGPCSIYNSTLDMSGYFHIRNIENNTVFKNITWINDTGGNYAVQITGSSDQSLDDRDAYNISFENIISSGLGLEARNIDNFTATNITIEDDFDATYASVLKLVRVHNFIVCEIIDDFTNNGIVMHGCTDGQVYNITVNGDFPGSIIGEGIKVYNDATGGISRNITITNCTVSNSGYAGISIKGFSEYIWITDCSADNGSHNGLDVRANYVYIENTHIENFNDSDGQNWHLSIVNHSTITNCSADGKGFYLNTGENNTIENFIQYNMSGTTHRPVGFGNEHNSKIINYSFVDYTSSNSYTMELFSLATGYFDPIWSNNNSIIDVDWYGLAASSDIRIVAGPYNNYINVNATTNLYDSSCNVTWWWYPNITVKDSDGDPIEEATLTFESNNSITPVNAYGDALATTTTTATGKMPTPTSNRTGCIALAEKFDDYASDTYYSWNITADADGYDSNTTIGHTFDDSCYTSNLDGFTGSEIVIILGGWEYNTSHTYTNVKYRYSTDGTRSIIGRNPLETDTDLGDNSTFPWPVIT